MNLSFAPSITPPVCDPDSPDVQVWQDRDGRPSAYGQAIAGENWMHVPRIGSFRLGDERRPSEVVPLDGAPRWQVVDTYFRNILPIALQLTGLEVLHGSAVTAPEGVVALCANSETGKSTLAFALRQRGMALFADDAVAFRIRGGRPVLGQVPFAIRLRKPSADHFQAQVREEVRIAGEPTPFKEVSEPFAAVCVIERLRNAPPSSPVVDVKRLSAAAAFKAVLPHGYRFLMRDRLRTALMMKQYLALVASVPVLEISFRSGLEHLPAILDELEGAVAQAHSKEAA